MGFFGKLIAVGLVSSAAKITEQIVKGKNRKTSNKYIKVGNLNKDFKKQNYKEVEGILKSYGFTNVSCVAKKDLKRNTDNEIFVSKKNKYIDGAVEKISINGETDFEEHDKFLPDAKVSIIYHTYPDTEKNVEEEEKLYAKCSACCATFDYTKRKPVCPYCGTPITK